MAWWIDKDSDTRAAVAKPSLWLRGVDSLQDGNDALASPASLDAWVLATWPRAVVFAQSLLRDPLAAEDVVQDCYCNLLRKADAYDLLRDGVPLLMKSITNACIKRNTRNRPMLSIHTLLESDGRLGSDPCVPWPASRQSRLHAELNEHRGSPGELPEVQRAAVELKGLGHSCLKLGNPERTPTNAGVLIIGADRLWRNSWLPIWRSRQDDRTGTTR